MNALKILKLKRNIQHKIQEETLNREALNDLRFGTRDLASDRVLYCCGNLLLQTNGRNAESMLLKSQKLNRDELESERKALDSFES